MTALTLDVAAVRHDGSGAPDPSGSELPSGIAAIAPSPRTFRGCMPHGRDSSSEAAVTRPRQRNCTASIGATVRMTSRGGIDAIGSMRTK